MEIELNEIAYDNFEVVDIDTKEIITGLVDGDFTKLLHTPSGTNSFITITEIVSGTYGLQFTPNTEGPWGVTLIHDTYFPWGKRGSYTCSNTEDTLDNVYTEVTTYSQYKADVSLLATEANATANTNTIITGIQNIDLSTIESGISGLAVEVWDEVLNGATHNIPSSAGRRLRQLGDTVDGSIVDVSPTLTGFITNISSPYDGFYDDQYIRFIDGNLNGVVRVVVSYTSSTQKIIVSEPYPVAPSNGDNFVIVPVHIHPIEQIGDEVWDRNISGHTTSGTFGYSNQYMVPSTVLDDYKADVSTLATESNATSNRNTIMSGISGVQADLDNPDQYKADVSELAFNSGVSLIVSKLPDQYIMGSSTPANVDDNIYAIQAKTDLIPSEFDTLLTSIYSGVINIETIITGMEGESDLIGDIYDEVLKVKARMHNYVITGIVRNQFNKSTAHELHTYYDSGYTTGAEDVDVITEYDANGNISKAEYKYAD